MLTLALSLVFRCSRGHPSHRSFVTAFADRWVRDRPMIHYFMCPPQMALFTISWFTTFNVVSFLLLTAPSLPAHYSYPSFPPCIREVSYIFPTRHCLPAPFFQPHSQSRSAMFRPLFCFGTVLSYEPSPSLAEVPAPRSPWPCFPNPPSQFVIPEFLPNRVLTLLLNADLFFLISGVFPRFLFLPGFFAQC